MPTPQEFVSPFSHAPQSIDSAQPQSAHPEYAISARDVGPIAQAAHRAGDQPRPSITVDLLRPDDLLNLHIEGYNLKLDAGDPAHPRLVRESLAAPAYLAVQFPFQHIQEQAFFEVQPPGATQLPPSDSDAPPPPVIPPPPFGTAPAQSRAAGPTRLVFRLPESGPGSTIPYSTEGLLDWSKLIPSLNPRAVPPGTVPASVVPSAPSGLETAIELPFRLLLSPDANATWAHDIQPVAHAGRTELWHTRLMRLASSGLAEPSVDDPAYARALWSRDFMSPHAREFEHADPFRASLTPYDRRQIVRLTSDYRLEQHIVLSDVVKVSGGGVGQVIQSNIGALGGVQMAESPVIGAQVQQQVNHPRIGGYADAQRHGEGTRIPLTVNAATPIAVERLMLSPLGGWLTSRGAWDPMDITDPSYNPHDPTTGDTFAVSEWRHIASQGRDEYVRVVYEGYLFPFGHRASLIKVTERKFLTASSGPYNGTPFAYLRQHMYIVVRQPTVTYLDSAFTNHGREMPLKLAQLTTLVTPDILPPESTSVAGDPTAFWVTVAGGVRFPFHVHTLDAYGHAVDFTAPLIFMVGARPPAQKGQPAHPYPLTDARLNSTIAGYGADINKIASATYGQKLTYAPPSGPSSDTTTLPTDAIVFTAQASNMPAGFVPTLRQADVRLPSMEHLLGAPAATTVKPFKDYTTNGFIAGTPGVFLQFERPLETIFSADKAGGIATPNMHLIGLSQQIGPVAGNAADIVNSLKTVAANQFDPSQFFPDASAALFGTISLPALLTGILPATAHAPKITTRALPEGEPVPQTVETSFEWHPPVSNSSGDRTVLDLLVIKPDAKFDLSAKVTKSLKDLVSPPTSVFKGSLTSFHLNFFQIIDVAFDRFAFTAQSGQKTDVSVNLAADSPVTFQGPLSFVNSLDRLIPAGGFGDNGPTLSLTPTEAKLGYSLALPPVACGVLSLQNVTFGAALTLPFLSGTPMVEFNFAERSHPFLLTVEVFGGGGFLHLQLDTKEVRLVEGAFEFGGNFALDLGVASGGVHVLAGIYFKLAAVSGSPGKTASQLDGFVRMGGELSVLGLISASLEFDLDLSYESSTGEARGQATLTIAVHVAFFSTSVDLTVDRSYGGSPGDPTFRQVVTADEWAAYAAAFG